MYVKILITPTNNNFFKAFGFLKCDHACARYWQKITGVIIKILKFGAIFQFLTVSPDFGAKRQKFAKLRFFNETKMFQNCVKVSRKKQCFWHFALHNTAIVQPIWMIPWPKILDYSAPLFNCELRWQTTVFKTGQFWVYPCCFPSNF